MTPTGAWKGVLVGIALFCGGAWQDKVSVDALGEGLGGVNNVMLLGAAIIVASVGYALGFRAGEKHVQNLLNPKPLTEAERNALLMKTTLPRWRRVAGWASFLTVGGLFYPFMYLAFKFGGSGWTSALAFLIALVASFAALIGGVWLCDLFWKPYRDAQGRLQQTRSEEEPRTQGGTSDDA